MLGGFTYDFDGVWQGRIAVGWRERNYKDPNLKNFAGPAVEGQLTWAPTLLTTVRFNVARTIEESIRRTRSASTAPRAASASTTNCCATSS